MRKELWILLAMGLPTFPAASQDSPVTLEVPAGWVDVTAAKKTPDILVALKGPAKSSFSLTRQVTAATSNRAAARTLLLDILSQVGRRSRLEFSEPGALKSQTFKNGLSADYIEVELKGGAAKSKTKLVLALAQYRGTGMVAALTSAVPEILFSPLLGSVKIEGAAPARAASGKAVSADSQLELSLPVGASPRDLGERELSQGLVLGVKTPDAEMWIKKIDEAGSDSKEESQNLKSTILSIPGAVPGSLSTVRSAPTFAGPSVLYVTAATKDSGGKTDLAVGFLPWGYWSYSLIAKGPGAVALLEEASRDLSMGPSADAKLLASTPKLEPAGKPGKKLLAGLAAAAALALGLAIRYTRK